jgi:hypothetical protein
MTLAEKLKKLKKIFSLLGEDLIVFWSHDGLYLKKGNDGVVYVISANCDFKRPLDDESVQEYLTYGGDWLND